MCTDFTDFLQSSPRPKLLYLKKDTKTKKQTRVPVLKLEWNGIFAVSGKLALVSRRLFIPDRLPVFAYTLDLEEFKKVPFHC